MAIDRHACKTDRLASGFDRLASGLNRRTCKVDRGSPPKEYLPKVLWYVKIKK
jgi:hypothetical protein